MNRRFVNKVLVVLGLIGIVSAVNVFNLGQYLITPLQAANKGINFGPTVPTVPADTPEPSKSIGTGPAGPTGPLEPTGTKPAAPTGR